MKNEIAEQQLESKDEYFEDSQSTHQPVPRAACDNESRGHGGHIKQLEKGNERTIGAERDADLYLTEYIKVEAIISPRNIRKFVIPIEIPYHEPKRKKTEPPKESKVGKIKMRNIRELQKQPEGRAVDVPAHHHQPLFFRPLPPCLCYQCTTYHHLYLPHPYFPPRRHCCAKKTAIWRPFI